jgi:hypothetical protein
LRGVVAFAHIHMRDLDWSPRGDPTRVFCLCWHHHHGCYDQGYISTRQLLEAEMAWIENKRRPEPHQRDVQLMRRVQTGEVRRICDWTEVKGKRLPTFEPIRPASDIRRSVTAHKAYATRWMRRAANAATEEEKVACLARAAEYREIAKNRESEATGGISSRLQRPL